MRNDSNAANTLSLKIITQLENNNNPKKRKDTRVAFCCSLWGLGTHPDPGLCEVGPHGDLLPRAHVRVAIPLESGLQLLQLLAGKVGSLPPLPLFLRRVV